MFEDASLLEMQDVRLLEKEGERVSDCWVDD